MQILSLSLLEEHRVLSSSDILNEQEEFLHDLVFPCGHFSVAPVKNFLKLNALIGTRRKSRSASSKGNSPLSTSTSFFIEFSWGLHFSPPAWVSSGLDDLALFILALLVQTTLISSFSGDDLLSSGLIAFNSSSNSSANTFRRSTSSSLIAFSFAGNFSTCSLIVASTSFFFSFFLFMAFGSPPSFLLSPPMFQHFSTLQRIYGRTRNFVSQTFLVGSHHLSFLATSIAFSLASLSLFLFSSSSFLLFSLRNFGSFDIGLHQ